MKKNLISIGWLLLIAASFVLIGSMSAETATNTTDTVTKKTEQAPVNKQGANSEKIEETFKKSFPRVPFDSIKPTDIKGFYEVTNGTAIIYYIADPGYVFTGSIISKEGKNLTEVRKADLTMEKAKNLPLDKALKMGSGKNTIVEFTDPDCPYCRKASEFLEQKKGITRYVFFTALPIHPDAANKIKYIFCANDKAKAYEDAMKGKLDDQKYQKCEKPEADNLMKVHKQIFDKMGISGTPFFIVNGKKAVVGSNTQEIEAALNK